MKMKNGVLLLSKAKILPFLMQELLFPRCDIYHQCHDANKPAGFKHAVAGSRKQITGQDMFFCLMLAKKSVA